jgi:5-methylthioadenosine/S-adenosylhomocysteine deaminase
MSDHEHQSVGDKLAIDLLVSADWLLTMDAERRVLRDGAVAVDHGAIVDVGRTQDLVNTYQPRRTIHRREGLMHPGLIESHVHCVHHLIRGLIPDTWPHTREHELWLPFTLTITDQDEHDATLLASIEMARNGITTFSDMGGRSPVEVRAEAIRRVGLRAALSETIWDDPPDPRLGSGDCAASLAKLQRFVDALPWDERATVWGAVNIPGMGRCSDDLLRESKALARDRGLVMAMHQSFADDDVASFESRTNGTAPIAHLDGLDLLGPDLTLVHVNRVTAEEVTLLTSSRTNVVHCPGASLRFGIGGSRHGRFPELVADGVTVGLGSDSSNFSDSFDILRQAYLCATIHREARGVVPTLTAAQALEMATVHGAHALGIGDRVGSLQIGKRADLVIHDTARAVWRPLHDPINTLIYSAQSSAVDTVIVDGRIVVEEGNVVSLDEQHVSVEMQRAGQRILDRMRT